jgi:hypothetical protein
MRAQIGLYGTDQSKICQATVGLNYANNGIKHYFIKENHTQQPLQHQNS